MLSTIQSQTRRLTFSSIKKLLQSVELVNRRWRLFQRDDAVLVALSGGPDSVALLFLLSKFRRRNSLKLFAAHLDHGLHSVRKRKYVALCKTICIELGIPLFIKSVDLKSRARQAHRGLEEMGRLERYAFLEALSGELKINKIATAHTQDDQVETVLMRVLRGSGLRGLVGIPVKRRLGKYELIRPLLFSKKSQLVAMLKKERIPFCQDPMNRSQDFTRNRIRHRLLPWIKEHINPGVENALVHLQNVAAPAADFLAQSARRALASCAVQTSERRVVLSAQKFKKLHPALKGEVLLEAAILLKGDTKRLTQAHIQNALDLAASDKGGRRCLLGGGILVEKGAKVLQISLKRDTIRPMESMKFASVVLDEKGG